MSHQQTVVVDYTGSLSYAVGQRWLGKSGQAAKWSFCLKAASMAAEQEIR
jgi:hypothetical protein